MRVTTLIAHKDYFQYLPFAIKSWQNQTYKSRLCIIDSSNKDEEIQKIIEEFSFKCSIEFGENYTKWYNHELMIVSLSDKTKETNPSILRNIGINLTIKDTDFYMILDADDEMLPTKTERFVDVFSGAPDEIGVVYGDHKTIKVVTREWSMEYREPYDAMRLRQECIVHSNAGVSSKALQDVKDEFGFYDSTMRTCEDYDLWMRISKKYMIIHLAECLSLVRVQPRNSTSTVDKDTWNKNWRRVHDKTH